jgi:PIN domain nuclease of toxin-antitoxin system
MKILLDTNVLLPAIEKRNADLSASIRGVLTSPDMEIFVSVANLWEIAIKYRLGKLDLGQPLERLPELISAIGMAIIDVTTDHVLTSVDPEPVTRDPFDRLLIAQCKVEGMKLLTVDRALHTHPLAWKASLAN